MTYFSLQFEHSTRDQSVGLLHSRLMWPISSQFLHLMTRSLGQSGLRWPGCWQLKQTCSTRLGQSLEKCPISLQFLHSTPSAERSSVQSLL